MNFLRMIFFAAVCFIFSSNAANVDQERVWHVAVSYVALMNGYGKAPQGEHADYLTGIDSLFQPDFVVIRNGNVREFKRDNYKIFLETQRAKGEWTMEALQYTFDVFDSTVCEINLLWSIASKSPRIFTIALRSLDGKTIFSIREVS